MQTSNRGETAAIGANRALLQHRSNVRILRSFLDALGTDSQLSAQSATSIAHRFHRIEGAAACPDLVSALVDRFQS
jgi:hypothetical protein